MNIFDEPGNLGAARGSLLTVLHADWPAYPEGDDFWTALLQLTAFPAKTEFIVLDDIDRCLLLMADVPCGKRDKPFDPRNFHVAVWHEDLNELARRDYIVGVRGASEDEWRKDRWSRMLSQFPPGTEMGHQDSNGTFVPIEPPRGPNVSFDDFESQAFTVSIDGRISVTGEGRTSLVSALRAENVDFSTSISPKVAKLFELKFFDSCIREACVQLEHEIKMRTGSAEWGDRLAESFITTLKTQGKLLESFIRTLRQELRAVLEFIRNDYMHNLVNADKIVAYTLLFRVARIRSVLTSC